MKHLSAAAVGERQDQRDAAQVETSAMKVTHSIIPEVSLVENGNVIPLPLAKRTVTAEPLVIAMRNELGDVEYEFPSAMDDAVKRMADIIKIREDLRKELNRLEAQVTPFAMELIAEVKKQAETKRKNKLPLWSRAPFARRMVIPLGLALGTALGTALGLASIHDLKVRPQVTLKEHYEPWVRGHVFMSHLIRSDNP